MCATMAPAITLGLRAIIPIITIIAMIATIDVTTSTRLL